MYRPTYDAQVLSLRLVMLYVHGCKSDIRNVREPPGHLVRAKKMFLLKLSSVENHYNRVNIGILENIIVNR